MCDTEPVLEKLCEAAQLPIEECDPEVLRDVISTCRDLLDRAETALALWGEG